ncbi:hypothetical protein CK203_042513 [Vitis vinifera]|uniref:Retrotransposon gag domain-containing protein n=1 Tax=Vitis vinifera TaxID=29760 RepID=A0A438HF10_VITVI|nr:hypothetical protein CK203_042513 [Vitis vinifera]
MAAQKGDNHESSQSATQERESKIIFSMGLVDSATTSDNVAASQKWRSENSFITSCLINTMKPTIGKMYMFLSMEKDVWNVIQKTYSNAENAFQIFELKTRLWQMKQGDREVMEYYIEMLGLWQELDFSCEEE